MLLEDAEDKNPFFGHPSIYTHTHIVLQGKTL